jgi:hypothetical protein
MLSQPLPQTRWTDELLDAMREVTDPPADQAVQSLFEQGDVDAVNALMNKLVKNDQIVPTDLPQCIQDYLTQTEGLPPWADPAKIKLAESFFGRCGLFIGGALYCASLPECYAAANGVQVLYLTARLTTDPKRRIGETAQMIIRAFAPGGLAPNGDGIRDAQKVRLMHAAVRHMALKSGQWNPEWGQPINQEDMAGTLAAFTWVVLDAMKKLGIKLTADEAESYLHGWRVIGHVMGLRSDMLPDDLTDAGELVQAIRRRQFRPCEAGRQLTQALIEAMEGQTPGALFKEMPATMIRFLLGDPTADILGVPNEDWTIRPITAFRKVFGFAEQETDRSRLIALAAEHFNRELLTSVAWIDRGGNRAPFSIPDVLRQQWGLPPGPATSPQPEATEGFQHPFAKIPEPHSGRAFHGLLALTLLLLVPMVILSKSLVTPVATMGPLSFELAGSAARAQAVIASWSEAERLLAAFLLGFDLLFLLALASTLCLACVRAANNFKSGAMAKAGTALAYGQWLAGLIWAVQNIVLVTMLIRSVDAPWPQIASVCSAIKFFLLLSGLAYLLIGATRRFASAL